MTRLMTGLIWLLAFSNVSLAAGLPDLSALDDAENSEFLPVAEAFQPQLSRSADTLQVHFDIAPGYYLYQNRLKATAGDSDIPMQFVQQPETKQDKNFGRVEVFHQQLDITLPLHAAGASLSYQGCSEHGLCYPPQTLSLGTPVASTGSAVAAGSDSGLGSDSLWWILLSFLGLGVGLSLTPCIFPMIPILSSIIVGQGSSRLSAGKGFSLALSYVVGMASSYAMIGMLVAAFGARVNLAAFTQTPIVISLAAMMFIILALPMFGLFELQLPGFLRNRLNDISSRQQGGHLLSTFLMGFFAALVVSPCVSAPLAGALIYLSTTGDIVTGGSALFALGIGMGAPLLLIGVSGGRLLPKAGTWMLTIKAAFGVGLLAVALGLLSRIIPAPMTLVLSGMLALGCAVYLGLLETPANARERFARSVALISAIIGIIWITGAALGNASLLYPLRSGTLEVTSREPVAEVRRVQSAEQLQQLLADAGQAVIVDVYADWCTSCREMDELLAERSVSAALAPYKVIRFDVTDSQRSQLDLLAEWQIFGPPALLHFDQGSMIGRPLQGLPDEEELLQWLQP